MKTTTWRLAARNASRRPLRTALTVGMVVFAVALLLVALTWVNGVMGQSMATATASGGHVRVVDPDFAAQEELSPLEENLPNVDQLAARVATYPGVVRAEPRITSGVTVTATAELGDVFAIAVGASERYFREQLGAKDKLVSGAWFTGAPDEIVAGSEVVRELSAKVGDELLLLGRTQDGSLSPIKGRLVGVMGATGSLDRQLLLPLAQLQFMTDIPNGATELLVYGARYEEAGAIAAALRGMPELKRYEVESWETREPWRSLGQSVQASQTVISLVIVLLAALGIWNTMMMSVLERTHELGVLRALGLSRLRAVGLFVGEAIVIGVVGGALGVLLGAGPSYLLDRYGLHVGSEVASKIEGLASETMHGDLSLRGVLTAFGLGLLMAVLGSLLPALRAANIQPVAAMRSGR